MSNSSRDSIQRIRHFRIVIAAIGALLAVCVLGLAGCSSSGSPAKSVQVDLEISGLDSTGSLIPVQVEGSDSAGNQVSDVQYVDASGLSLSLSNGEYTLSIPASPIGGDGTLWAIPEDTVQVTVTDDTASTSDAGTFIFSEIDDSSVTKKYVDTAYRYASSGGCDSEDEATSLYNRANEKYLRISTTTSSSSRSSTSQSTSVVSATSYDFTIPSYWSGKVRTNVSGNTIDVISSTYPDRTICTITVSSAQTTVDDIGYGLMGYVDLGDGSSIQIWAPRYPYLIAHALYTGSTDPDDYYTMDEANELVSLQTGGEYDYSDVLDVYDPDNESGGLTYCADSFFANKVLTGISIR